MLPAISWKYMDIAPTASRLSNKGTVIILYELAHLGIVVSNCERSADFYKLVFGCTVVDHLVNDTMKIIYLQCGDLTIELLEYITDSPASRQAGIYDHLAFTVADIQAAVVSLKEQGFEFESANPRLIMNGKKIIFFSGPDGERIELMEA